MIIYKYKSFKELINIKENNCKIEIEKINLILEDKFSSYEKKEKFIKDIMFNNKTIDFLKTVYEKYTDLNEKKNNSVIDCDLYNTLLTYINEQCKYAYKLSRDFKHISENMKKGIYHELDVTEIEKDIKNIRLIIEIYK